MEFKLTGEYIELCSLLKAANLVMSGGEGKEVVAQGLVTVDGELELRKRCKIR
ncbi:MAG: RNA-binding S4 domain-containing protein, partial [Lentisphaerae bacterium]|nr:RNA-binding S4 domain-containing protein [Lentisphaerota bacterium]